MIKGFEIRKKAERLYDQVLRAAIGKENIFPIKIRANTKRSTDFSMMWKEMEELMTHSKDRKGFGYSVISEAVNTRNQGKQNLPKEIIFETQKDYLLFLAKAAEFEDFAKSCSLILSKFPQLKELLSRSPMLVVKNAGKWPHLLTVCSWFVENNQVDVFYIRELPISIHTKFIEENKAVLATLLEVLVPEKIKLNEKTFEKKFGLRYKEPLVRFRFLDNTLNPFLPWDDISIPVSQFAAKPLACQKIFVVENEMNFLTFPKVENALAIWGKGYAVESLKEIAWLSSKCIYYWSDLDAQGFQMLSQLRSYFPQAISLLMDKQVLADFSEFIVQGTPTTVDDCRHLNEKESEVYDYLRINNLRLEQERVTQRYLMKILDKIR